MGSLDTEPLDVSLLRHRALHYAQKAGATEASLGKALGSSAAAAGAGGRAGSSSIRLLMRGACTDAWFADGCALHPKPCHAAQPQGMCCLHASHRRLSCCSCRKCLMPCPILPPAPPVGRLAAFLDDPVTQAILDLPEDKLDAYLINDAYKPRMHKCACGCLLGSCIGTCCWAAAAAGRRLLECADCCLLPCWAAGTLPMCMGTAPCGAQLAVLLSKAQLHSAGHPSHTPAGCMRSILRLRPATLSC